tara:strand:- start:3953 stop:4387 length:435 start_codon:yes stop_codon:yes gene_type:complete
MNQSKRSTKAPRSQGDLFKFLSKPRNEVLQDLIGCVLAFGSDVEFGVIEFRMAREVVGIFHVFVVVKSLSEHLESRVAFTDNAEAQFILFSKKQFHRHDDQLAHWPTCFEPSPENGSEKGRETSNEPVKIGFGPCRHEGECTLA